MPFYWIKKFQNLKKNVTSNCAKDNCWRLEYYKNLKHLL